MHTYTIHIQDTKIYIGSSQCESTSSLKGALNFIGQHSITMMQEYGENIVSK